MVSCSVLSRRPDDAPERETTKVPACFGDLNLDQIVRAITAHKRAYNLKAFFYASLEDADDIVYRQEVARDLEDETLMARIKAFATRVATMRRYLGLVKELTYPRHKKGWFLEAVGVYCSAVKALAADLNAAPLTSRGLAAFRDYLNGYVADDDFVRLATETRQLKADLAAVTYTVLINGRHVKVRRYASEVDYAAEIETIFEKFRQGDVKDYRVNLTESSGMSWVEAQILDLVARLYPEPFASLDVYCKQHGGFLDETINVFDREVQFYVAYLDYIAPVKAAGLRFCYPRIVTRDKTVSNRDGFDLALAHKLIAEGEPVVCNSFHLEGPERIFTVSGPNQGGKTTFARTFGQLHILANVGCPVPGTDAQLFLFDAVYAHFERAEDIRNLRGKLEDDLIRIRQIFDRATSKSIIIMNEIFTSTTLEDATVLGGEVLHRILDLDALGVYVTFIDELANGDPRLVSVVSTVVPEDPTRRTYKIVRRRADGVAYALSIAEKHRLTYDRLLERLPR